MHKGICIYVKIHVYISDEVLCIPRTAYGFLWIVMDPYGLPMDSCKRGIVLGVVIVVVRFLVVVIVVVLVVVVAVVVGRRATDQLVHPTQSASCSSSSFSSPSSVVVLGSRGFESSSTVTRF